MCHGSQSLVKPHEMTSSFKLSCLLVPKASTPALLTQNMCEIYVSLVFRFTSGVFAASASLSYDITVTST